MNTPVSIPEFSPDSSMEKEIVFAGGCFWGTQELFSSMIGVISTEAGYANGNGSLHANYPDVCSGLYGFREAVRIHYNPVLISLESLVFAFFASIDPEQYHRQGMDCGVQYQTGIYWLDPEDGPRIELLAGRERRKHREFHTEIQPLSCFFPAEEYHQNYLKKHPDGYCHIPRSVISDIQSFLS